MKVGVIGTGYVGLVTGSCLAESGNSVICMDIDKDKIERLKKGDPVIYEPGLKELIENNLRHGRLEFTTDLRYVVENSFLLLIAVPTPESGDGSADLSAVLEVASSIGDLINDYKIIVTKSTVPVGTTEKVRDIIRRKTDIEFDVASNPEFLKEGSAVEDFMRPDRVVIGVDKPSVGAILRELYQPFMRSGDRAHIISIRSSELSKYASNAMLACRISFMNEMANLCELLGADVSEVRLVMGSDHRIGRSFLFPGVGYGGSCLPKDVKALIHTAKELGYHLRIATATDEVNSIQRELFFKKLARYFNFDLRGKRVALWGLSFKPKTNDIREAPSLYIIDKLLENGARVAVHDPVAIENVKRRYGERLLYTDSSYDACVGADALVILTEWNEYRQPDFEKIKDIMAGRVVFDGRNLYDPKKMQKMGFEYFAVGLRCQGT